MLLPKTAHFAPGLRCDTITKNVYPGAAAMEYIMQRKQDGNTCGAFVLAYYQWEKTGCETVQEEAGRAYVEQLYWEIVFGSTMPGFETYSNPVLMMRWLAQHKPGVALLREEIAPETAAHDLAVMRAWAGR